MCACVWMNVCVCVCVSTLPLVVFVFLCFLCVYLFLCASVYVSMCCGRGGVVAADDEVSAVGCKAASCGRHTRVVRVLEVPRHSEQPRSAGRLRTGSPGLTSRRRRQVFKGPALGKHCAPHVPSDGGPLMWRAWSCRPHPIIASLYVTLYRQQGGVFLSGNVAPQGGVMPLWPHE